MSATRTLAIVPVKALGQAKRRLSSVLPDAARQRLMLTMLEDVLGALAGVACVDGIAVVTPDERVAALARAAGAIVVPEPGAGELNAAVAAGVAFAVSHGAVQALIVPADVPLATSEEIAALVRSRGSQPGVTLAPAHDGGGTNGLLLAPPGAFSPGYGPGSYVQHLSQAMARRVDLNVVHLPGLARDIDEPADLLLLAAAKAGMTDRYDFLSAHGARVGGAPPRPTIAEEQ